MKKLTKQEIKKYLEFYDLEYFLFNNIGKQVKRKGYLDFDDFFAIAMWKSNRQKPNYLKNKDSIKSISKLAFRENDESKKIELLCSLSGVGIPTASAILTVVFPERYAIIDIRCVEMLKKLGFKLSNNMSVNNWIEYLKTMRGLAKKYNITPREMDKVFFAMHREMLNKDNFKNLYKY